MALNYPKYSFTTFRGEILRVYTWYCMDACSH